MDKIDYELDFEEHDEDAMLMDFCYCNACLALHQCLPTFGPMPPTELELAMRKAKTNKGE